MPTRPRNISARGRAFADKVKCVPLVLSPAARGISDAVRDAAELMGKGYEEIKAAAAGAARSVAAAAKHCADATANVPTRHLPKASHGAPGLDISDETTAGGHNVQDL